MNTVTVSTIEEYIEEVSKIKHSKISKTLYRGQANYEWPIHSSAFRRLLKSFPRISDIDLKIYLIELLNDARRRIIETKSDTELLIEVQHFGGATNLIDFSKNPLVALYFACNGEYGKAGTVFSLITESSHVKENFYEMKSDVLREKSISEILALENKSANLIKINPPFQNNRVIKQESVLIMTKDGTIDDSYIDTRIIIEKKAKKEILNKLECVYCISEENLFIDFHGWAFQNSCSNWISIDPNVFAEYAKKECSHDYSGNYEAIELYSKAIQLDAENKEYYFE